MQQIYFKTVALPWKTDFTSDNKHCFIFLTCQALFSHSSKGSCTPDTYVKNHCLSLSNVFKLKCCQIFFILYWVQLVLSICSAIYWNMATHCWPHPQRKMTIPPQQSSAANNLQLGVGTQEKSIWLIKYNTFQSKWFKKSAVLNILKVLHSTWHGTHLPKYLFSRQPSYWACIRLLYTRPFITKSGKRRSYSRLGIFLIITFTAPPRALINEASVLFHASVQ